MATPADHRRPSFPTTLARRILLVNSYKCHSERNAVESKNPAKGPRIFPRRFLSSVRCPLSSGFTLIELLVVITIIVILVSFLFPAYRGVHNQAKKAQAKNDLTQIVTAVNAYYTEYGKYPVATDDSTISNNGDLFYTLRAVASGANAGNALNARQIVFTSPPDAKDQTIPRAGIKNSTGEYFDPWGTKYLIAMDGTYDNQVPNPYPDTDGSAGASPLRQGVIVWSYGSDQTQGNKSAGSLNFKDSDDVISWQ
jgi:prepilin-type N-terminal cleavage/methylation domain-containing protein